MPEVQTAKQLDDFQVQRRQAGFGDGFLAQPNNGFIHLLINFPDDFFDPCRMDAAIGNEPHHRFPCYLASHPIKTGLEQRAGGIIDQHRHSGRCLEGADIAALPPNDSPFDLIALQRDGGGGVLERVLAGIALDGDANDLPRFFFGFSIALNQSMGSRPKVPTTIHTGRTSVDSRPPVFSASGWLA